MDTYRVYGDIAESAFQDRVFDVGLFTGPRFDAEPVVWERTSDGRFSLEAPPGTYYLHAMSGIFKAADFFDARAWGSYGGLYGFGTSLDIVHDTGPLHLTVTGVGRDLLHAPGHRQVSVSNIQSEWVRQVERMLLEDPWQSITNVADQLSVNRIYLSATFKRVRGMTIEEYRSCVRIEAAKTLLVQSNHSLITVADEVGYESISQLSRAFQQLVGMTPGQFRDLARTMCVDARLSRAQSPPFHTTTRAGIRFLSFLDRLTATIRGTVRYDGLKRGQIIYIGAFRTPTPTSYPVGWTSLPKPGDFTLRCIASGPVYVMACYCQKPMRYPGDMRTAFADGVYVKLAEPAMVEAKRGEAIETVDLHLRDSDTAARHSSPWLDVFLPDGR